MKRAIFFLLSIATVSHLAWAGDLNHIGVFNKGLDKDQDAFSYKTVEKGEETWTIAAVCDGHGGKAEPEKSKVKDLAQYVCKTVLDNVADNIKNGNIYSVVQGNLITWIQRAVNKVDETMLYYPYAGTTLVGFIYGRGQLRFFNVGDSSGYAILPDCDTTLQTRTHDLSDKEELSRHLQNGCTCPIEEHMRIKEMEIDDDLDFIKLWESYGFAPLVQQTRNKGRRCRSGLALSRSIGDHDGRKSCPAIKPEVELSGVLENPKLVMLATDGISDIFHPLDIGTTLHASFGKIPLQELAESIGSVAEKKWLKVTGGYDDVTLLIFAPKLEEIHEGEIDFNTLLQLPDYE